MTARCCPECFDDRGLRNYIIPSPQPKKGTCNYCHTVDVDLVEPGQLADVFELLLGAYEVDARGKPLVEWMKEDWQLFSHDKMDAAHAKELLAEILNDGDIVRRNFVPAATYKSEALGRWETLRNEIMYRNRYFPDAAIDVDRLAWLIDQLPADEMPAVWYRARITAAGGSAYLINEMGSPPNRLATHGRANPPGIPYLYVGSMPQTAVAEVRPHTGEVACVADFTIVGSLRAIDLRNPRKLVSPFVLGDAAEVGQLRADIPFLERMGDELTRPVLPSSAAIDYIPSQYLYEFIKKSGYDGVVYRSSVSTGMNLALFNPNKAKGGSVVKYNVSRVQVEIDPA